MRSRLVVAGVLAVGVGVLAACDQSTPTAPPGDVSFNHAGDAGEAHFLLCKEGAEGMFNVTILENNRPAHGTSFSVVSGDADNTSMVTVAAGECLELFEAPLFAGETTDITDITVDEIVKPGFQLDKIVWDSIAHGITTTRTITGTTSFTTGVRDDIGAVVTFFNSPLTSCAICKGGVTEMTLQNNGPDATVTVTDKRGNVLFDDFVVSGDSFTFNGVERDGKMGTEITVTVNGVETKIHTSCSRPIGPGAVFGDFEVVEAFSKDNGRICPPPECTVCKGGLTQMTLQNNGPDATITVEGKRGRVLFSGFVASGDSFTFNGVERDGKMGKEITVIADGVRIKIHTSCSRPVGPGAVFGDFEVLEAFSHKGGKICPVPPPPPCSVCQGGVTQMTLQNNGPDATITVTDKKGNVLFDDFVAAGDSFTFSGVERNGKMGTEITVDVNGIQTKIHTSCSQPIGPGAVFGDLEVLEAFSLRGGKICPVPPPPPCSVCQGGVTQMTLQNNGADATITVTDKKGNILFNGFVVSGDSFAFNGVERDGKMGTEITVDVNGVQTKIHTSCSQPIGPGAVFGDFEVLEAFSLRGGKICPTTGSTSFLLTPAKRERGL